VKLLILQLGDIHFRGETDPVRTRIGRVVDAVRSADYEVDGCIILFAGDVAHSGAEAEYIVAFDFAAELRRALADAWSGRDVVVRVAVVPGNHDCDFSSERPARDQLLATLTGARPATPAMQVCTEVQEGFFQWRDALNEGELLTQDRLYYEYLFRFGAETVLVRCLNTAWASRLKEQPATLYFPEDLLAPPTAEHTLVLTVMHHPYNWLLPENARALRKRVEEVCDIILTGHEHDFGRRHLRGGRGETNLYIEGSALQEAGAPNDSAFNCLVVDTSTKRQKIQNFRWNGARYSETKPHGTWEPYQVNKLRAAERFEVTQSFATALDEPGLGISHPSRPSLRLDDFFVHPDLVEVVYREGLHPETIRGEQVVGYVAGTERLLITGPEKSGKTALAKQLFKLYHEKGYVPLLLRGEQLRVFDDERTYGEFETVFPEQYSGDSVDAYKQLDRRRRVLIVDDFHRLRLKRSSLDAALAQMTNFAGQLVLLANDLAQHVNEIIGKVPGGVGTKMFPHFRLQQYGQSRRVELCEKWFSIDRHFAEDQEAFSRKLMDAKVVMDTIIGRNFVPAYPVFMLPMLQAQQADQAVDISASTYGYFYELLIKRALALGSTKASYDVKLAYLAFLAFSLFRDGADELTDRDFRRIHADYETVYGLELDFGKFTRDLIACGIFEERNSKYYFKYDYYYYYFVAAYIRDHILEQDVQQHIAGLAERLHEEDSANILLFLAHLSRHPFIIDQMLTRARALFDEAKPATLRPEDSPLPDLDRALDAVVFEDKGEAGRTEVLARIDASQRSQQRGDRLAELEEEDPKAFIVRINVGFRSLQILGQILKNFPGSIPAEQKKHIARECYGVGLRLLGFLFEAVKLTKDDFVRMYVSAVRADASDLEDAEIVKRARESMHSLTFSGAYGMVRRVARAVGSPHLAQTYEALLREEPTPARKLITASVHLDQFKKFPKEEVVELGEELMKADNAMGLRVLQTMVVNHFYVFSEKFDLKQHVCAKLGVKYKPLQAADPRVRLIGERSSSDDTSGKGSGS
jgi:hypothetical protein